MCELKEEQDGDEGFHQRGDARKGFLTRPLRRREALIAFSMMNVLASDVINATVNRVSILA